nr:hypothetical protein [Tanacetum cinerariifolium]
MPISSEASGANMENIRAYNQMFAMTSFRAQIDNSVNRGTGPYLFKISDQIYHWIDSLFPEQGHHPRFLQLYIYDTHNEVENKMHHFGGVNEGTINLDIVQGLIHVLDEQSGMGGVHGYELPTFDILRGIEFESGPRSKTDFHVIIEFRGGPPQRINKLHQYTSLQFPLLFVFNEPRFYPKLN